MMLSLISKNNFVLVIIVIKTSVLYQAFFIESKERTKILPILMIENQLPFATMFYRISKILQLYT